MAVVVLQSIPRYSTSRREATVELGGKPWLAVASRGINTP